MAITIDDFNKIWASTSPLTPYTFSDANYRQGWNFVGATPPSRQMWDSWLKMTDEKCQYLYNHEDVPVGHEYFTFNPNIPQGSLPLFGGEYSRETYSALWNWVQEQTGYLKTEAEWQTLATANNGNVPYYSDGDGSTTFRVPALNCWMRSANGTVSEVGSYLQAGLPNITGRTRSVGGDHGVDSFYMVSDGSFAIAPTNGSSTPKNQLGFDASRSSSIYGKSSTVQPASVVGMWLVKAYGTVADTGVINEQQYIDDRIATEVTRADGKYLPLAGGTMTGNVVMSADTSISAFADNQSIGINGGTAWDKGAWMSVWGKDHATYPGYFGLHAKDGTNDYAFVGKPNGSLLWNGDSVAIIGNLANGHGILTGSVSNISVSANGYTTGSVSFGQTFDSSPIVVTCISSGHAHIHAGVSNVTTTSFNYIVSSEGSSQTVSINWIAIG